MSPATEYVAGVTDLSIVRDRFCTARTFAVTVVELISVPLNVPVANASLVM